MLRDKKNEPLRPSAARRNWFLLSLVALLCSLAALVGGTVVFAWQVERTQAQVERQAALQLRLRDLQGLVVTLADAEGGQRGYLLTGKPRYLEPYKRAVAAAPALLVGLEATASDYPKLRQRITDVRPLIDLKLAELAETVRLYESGREDDALALVDSDAGVAYTERIRTDVGWVLDSVRDERNALNLEIAAGAKRSQWLLIATVSMFLLFIVVATLQLVLSLRARTRTEHALAQSEQQHRALVEEQSELVSQSQPDGNLVYVNPAYARFFGREPEEMVGTSLYDHVGAADREVVRGHLNEVLRTGKSRESENRMVLADGGERWVAWTNLRQTGPDGEPLLHSVGRDFTERRLAEQRLAESERFIRQVTDNLPVRIAYADQEQRFRFVNRLHCLRFGKERSEVLGRTRAELTGGATDDVVAPHVQQALAGKRQRFEFEEVVDGKVRRIESQLIPDIDDEGQVRGIYTTGMDITERTAVERALRELNEVVEHTPDFVVQTDARGMVHYMNPAVRRVLGLAADAPLQGLSFSDFHTPATKELFAREVTPALLSKGVWSGEAPVYVQGGRELPVNHMVIAHQDERGRPVRFSSVMRDISEQVAARERLGLQTAMLQSVTEAIPAMVAVLDANQRYRFVNRALESWFGLPREELIGHTALEVLGEEEYERSRPWIERVLAGETVNFQKDLVDRPVHLAVHYIPVHLAGGEVDGFVSVSQDITPQHRENIRLLQLVEFDALTGLLNRAGFEKYMADAMARGEAASLALLYIDLDHFKPVNDQHGHPVGDELLRQFAQRMRSMVRPGDAVARLGGDEFAVVLCGVRQQSGVAVVADKILDAAHEPFSVGELQLRIGASIGLAFDASDASGLQGLVARADSMLYKAKAAGRGRRA